MKLYTNISLLYTYSITPNAQRQPAFNGQTSFDSFGPSGPFPQEDDGPRSGL